VNAQGRSEIYTIGHGTRTLDELITVLRLAGVELLIDVRRFPGSRRHPHFAREALEQALPQHGLSYEWKGESLGGRRSRSKAPTRHPAWNNASFQSYADYMDTDDFRAAVRELEERSVHVAQALMCAETLWWKCHRRLISDALVLHGAEVVHLVRVGTREPHKLHPNVRQDSDGWPVYDVNVDRQLDRLQ
jgi:uncharacterized protein (DUF488 family)